MGSNESHVLETILKEIESSGNDLIQTEYNRVLNQFGSVNIKSWQSILKKLCTNYNIPSQLLNQAISKPKDSEHIDIDVAVSQLTIFIKQKLIEIKNLERNQPKNDNKDIYEAFPFYTEENLEEANESNEPNTDPAVREFKMRLEKCSDWLLAKMLEKEDLINTFRNLLSVCKVNAEESQIQNFISEIENWQREQIDIKMSGGYLFEDEEYAENIPTEANSTTVSLHEFKEMAINWFSRNKPYLLPQDMASPIPNKKKIEQKDHLSLLNLNSSPRMGIKSSEISLVSKSSPSPFGGSVQTFGATGDTQYPTEPDEFQQKLMKTISDYEEIKYEKLQNNEDTSIIDALLKSLKAQLKKSQEKNQVKRVIKEKPLIERFKAGIHEVFNFYACQQNLLGLHQNFDLIKKNSETFNLGKFTIFCKDFTILDVQKNPNKKSLPKKAIKQIFIKNAINHREMNEDIFVKVLDSIAQLFLDTEYDSINGTNFKDLELDEKKLKFYEILGFHDPQIYLKKCKGFSQPFGPDLLTRIPKDDIANKFDLKKKQKLKQSVQEWKKTKQSDQDSKQRKSSTHVIAHSVPSDAIIFARKVAPSPPETYKAKMTRKNSDPITWKGLGNMQPNELVGIEEEFKYENLIINDDSSTDEYLKKEYPLENTPSQAVLETFDSDKKEASPGNLLKPQNKISNKTLKRAGELLEVSKRNEEKIIQKGLKLSNARMERLNKYATKFKKL